MPEAKAEAAFTFRDRSEYMKKVNWKLVLSVVVAAEVIAFLLGGLCGLMKVYL